jgi:hypothetical protein
MALFMSDTVYRCKNRLGYFLFFILFFITIGIIPICTGSDTWFYYTQVFQLQLKDVDTSNNLLMKVRFGKNI